MGFGVHAQELAVCGHDVSGQQGVDREAVLAGEISDAAAQRDPADSDRAGIAEPDSQAMRPRSGCEFACGQTGLGPGRSPLGINVQRTHIAQVEHDASVSYTVADDTVTSTADGEFQSGIARQRDDICNVSIVCDPHDKRRAAVNSAVKYSTCLIVTYVVRRDYLAFESRAEGGD